MEDEVPNEVQAAMSLKLMDNVRKLIRDELKLALQDETFLAQVYTYPLAISVANGVCGSPQFHSAVKNVITSQMNKY
jgi:hypothetical protein